MKTIYTPTSEDLTMLDLLISKLEESFNLLSPTCFEHECFTTSLSNLSSESSYYDESWSSNETVKPNLIKRTVISFNSKGNFYHWGEEQKKMKDDGVYTDSQIKITWDYITNKFEICVGENSYEKDPHNTGYVRSTGPVKNADIELDFGDKYRYEIKSMKIRLGKLYKKVHRDLKAFNDQRVRKVFTDVATHVFPDILDPLILGSFSSEKRNDRGVSNEGRKDPSDTSSTP